MEMHHATVEAMRHGYSFSYSPILLNTDVIRALKTQVSRLDSNPQLAVDDALRAAQQELDKLSQRSLSRNTALEHVGNAPAGR